MVLAHQARNAVLSALLALLAATPQPALATEVTVVGISPTRVALVINGVGPRWLAVDATIDGVKLISTDGETAELVVDGKRQALHIGQYYGTRNSSERQSASLTPDINGHYIVSGSINGGSVRFLVDTGASYVTLSTSDARRLGINYLSSPVVNMGTANGVIQAYRVLLDNVRIGDITLTNVPATVQEAQLPVGALLGMSFLSRTEISHDGANMVLTRRF